MQFKVVDVLIDYYTNKPKDAINEILERYLGNGSQERKDLRKWVDIFKRSDYTVHRLSGG